ncbi:MAG: ATP-binding protein [Ignavibacteriales bacterium]|nr:ATP-binding protein [Ignavibacteriales bacterium]
MDKPTQIIQLHLPSILGFEKVAMESAASVAAIMGFTNDRIDDLRTAISEACVNAIEHGNKQVETEKVIVTLTIEESKLQVDVQDKGKQFLPEVGKPNIAKKIDGSLPPRGWGMFLIKSLMDEVAFSSQDDGNTTTMIIYLHKKYTNEREQQ